MPSKTGKKSVSEKKPAKSQSSPVAGIIAVVVFIILLVVAIGLGLAAERRFGNTLLQSLPKNITSTWGAGNIPTVVRNNIEPTTTPTSPIVPTEAPPPPDETVSESEYMLAFSNTRKVTREDIVDLTPWELKVAKNEIYARHGRPFVHKDLACYFAKQSWYSVDPAYTEKSLSSLEVANAVFILSYEKEINSTLVNQDSGCK